MQVNVSFHVSKDAVSFMSLFFSGQFVPDVQSTRTPCSFWQRLGGCSIEVQHVIFREKRFHCCEVPLTIRFYARLYTLVVCSFFV